MALLITLAWEDLVGGWRGEGNVRAESGERGGCKGGTALRHGQGEGREGMASACRPQMHACTFLLGVGSMGHVCTFRANACCKVPTHLAMHASHAHSTQSSLVSMHAPHLHPHIHLPPFTWPCMRHMRTARRAH